MAVENYDKLYQFQRISQKMLEIAEDSGWDKLADLEIERKSLIASFLKNQISPQDTAQIEQVIEEVIAINDKIAQLAEQEKVLVGEQLQGLKKKHDVHSAYLQNK